MQKIQEIFGTKNVLLLIQTIGNIFNDLISLEFKKVTHNNDVQIKAIT